MARSLTDYANETQRITPTRWFRTAPERDEVLTGYRAGVPARVIYRWLRDECGYQPDQLPLLDSFVKYLRTLAER